MREYEYIHKKLYGQPVLNPYSSIVNCGVVPSSSFFSNFVRTFWKKTLLQRNSLDFASNTPGAGLVNQILRIVDKHREVNGSSFLDVPIAFNRLFHWKFFFRFQVTNVLVQLVASFSKGRRFCIRLGNVHLSERPLGAGVYKEFFFSHMLQKIEMADTPHFPGPELPLYVR